MRSMSHYSLYQSNYLEDLVESVLPVMDQGGLFDESLWIIVQNRNMAEWLKLEMARRKGICARMEFLLPDQAVRRLAEGFPAGRSDRPLLFMDTLKVRVYLELKEILAQKTLPAGYEPLLPLVADQGGIDSEGEKSISQGNIFALADKVAGLFIHYGMNSQGLSDAWERGVLLEKSPGRQKEHEVWQRDLWLRLFSTGPRRKKAPLLMSSLVSTIVGSPDDQASAPAGAWSGGSQFPQRILLFGSAFLSERYTSFFLFMSRFVEVHHALLTASRCFIPGHEREGCQEGFLRDWGRLSSGFCGMLRGRVTGQDLFRDRGGEGVLGRLQNSLAQGELPVPQAPDETFQVISVPGVRREVEVLKDRILHLLTRDGALQLPEICVLAPDINQYRTAIEGVFQDEQHGTALPYHILDLTVSRESPLIDGTERLWTLAQGRFSLEEVFPLLRNPCFQAAAGAEPQDLELWEKVIQEKEIRWGFSPEERSARGAFPSGINTWEQGIQAILDDLRTNTEWEGQILMARARLAAWMEGLHERLARLVRAGRTQSLAAWVAETEKLFEDFLKPRPEEDQDNRDRRSLRLVYQQIQQLADDLALTKHPFSFSSFRLIYKEIFSRLSQRKGAYLTRGISFSSFKPLRAIPFKHIFVLGLNEGVFPGREEALSFDLRSLFTDIKIDMSPRESDRFAFLELLISARESLTLMYHGRDPQQGSPREPSTLVQRVMEAVFVRPGAEEEDHRIQEEALHRWNPRYYPAADSASPEKRPPSFNRRGWRELRSFLRRKGPAERETPGKGITGASSPPRGAADERLDLTVDDLLAFMKNPVRHYAEKGLGLFFGDKNLPEENSLEKMDPEFFESLSLYEDLLMRDDLLSSETTPEDLAQGFVEELAARESLSDGWLREYYRDVFLRQIKEFFFQRKAFGLNNKGGSAFLCRMGESRPQDPVWAYLPPWEGETREGLPYRLTGSLSSLRFDSREKELWMLGFCPSPQPRVKHWMKQYLQALCCAAHVEKGRGLEGAAQRNPMRPEKYQLHLLGPRIMPRLSLVPGSTELPPGEEGPRPWIPEDQLNRLVSLYEEGLHRYLPWETGVMDTLVKEAEKKGWEAAVKGARGNWTNRHDRRDYRRERDALYQTLLGDPPPDWEDPLLKEYVQEILPLLNKG